MVLEKAWMVRRAETWYQLATSERDGAGDGDPAERLAAGAAA